MILANAKRRRSCELVNTPLPCVNKAVYHIEELELKMKEWFLQHGDIVQKNSDTWVSGANSGDLTSGAISESPKLHIKGFRIIDQDLQHQGRVGVMKKDSESVISEVLELIWRLEADRQEAEAALLLETERKGALIKKIDGLSLWKLSHMPEATQKEYDACAQDISELQWHIACKKKDLERAHNKAAKTEAVNARLQEEIIFINKHSPLLEDKLNIEGEAMMKIKQAQAEATVLLNEAEDKCQVAQRSFDQATEEANQERAVMRAELDELERTLQSCRDGLLCAENMWDEYNSKISHTENKIAEGKNLYTDLLEEKQQLIDNEGSWTRQVTDLKYEMDDQEMKNKNLTIECSKLSQEAELNKSDIQSQLSHLETLLHNKLHALRDLEYTNKTLELEAEDLSRKIKISLKAKTQHETDILRMRKSLLSYEEQTMNIIRELSQLSVNHIAVKSKLADLEDRVYKEETRLKNLLDGLRKQIIDETKASQLTQVQITAILTDLQRRQKESKNSRVELIKAVAEVEEPAAELEAKMITLRDMHCKKSEKLRSALQERQDSDEKFNLASQQLGHRKNTLKQQLSDTQNQLYQVSEQLKQTIEGTEKLRTEIRDLIQYGTIVENKMNSTRISIEKLQDNYNELQQKLNNTKDISEHLLNEVEMCTQRLQMEKEDHQKQLGTRQKNLIQGKAALKASINENIHLAKKYQILQVSYLNEKDKLMRSYEKRLKMEATMRDYLQEPSSNCWCH
ncbi:coiled-coil domain-containing protein 178 isoform 2-T2 [Rhinophrynus dorsalis]